MLEAGPRVSTSRRLDTEGVAMSDQRFLPEIEPVERRTFLRYSLIGSTAAGLGAFGLGSLGFLWPNIGEGFGATFTLGNAEEVLATIRDERAPLVNAAGRMYVVEYDPSLPGAEQYDDVGVPVGDAGLMSLYHTCPHLGCRVPWCQSSQWFECPCHGSKYNRWGEWTGGPAPRGMDRFTAELDGDGNLLVHTAVIVTGTSRTARVLSQEPEGPACIDL
jgi:cytochrome b6-f complex iron-sulfur subunit